MRLDGELKRQKEAAELGEMKTTETEVKRRKVNYLTFLKQNIQLHLGYSTQSKTNLHYKWFKTMRSE